MFIYLLFYHFQINIAVEQLPELDENLAYMCAFDDYEQSATRDGSVVNCETPPVANVPPLPPGCEFLVRPHRSP